MHSLIRCCRLSGTFLFLLSLVTAFGHCSPLLASPRVELGLSAILSRAEQHADRILAIDDQLQALIAEIEARDIVLSPSVSVEGSASRDRRDPTGQGGEAASRGETATLRSTARRPFASGLEASLSLEQDIRDSRGGLRRGGVFDWQLRLSQDLWRNSLGRETELRRAGERLELETRTLALVADRQALIRSIEDRYWEYLLRRREYEIRARQVERSRELVTWMQNRLERFAAEEIDLTQVQALLAQRQLDLSEVENSLRVARNELEAQVPGLSLERVAVRAQELSESRDPTVLLFERIIDATSDLPISLRALSARYRMDQERVRVAQVEDQIRPSLEAFIAYGGNGVESSIPSTWADSAETDRNVAQLGLLFSRDLDTSLQQRQLDAARLSASALTRTAQAEQRESLQEWVDILGTVENLEVQSENAARLLKLQQKKVEAERARFEQGKSTTFQLTSFEIELGESELRLARIFAAQRREEARARLFVAGAKGQGGFAAIGGEEANP